MKAILLYEHNFDNLKKYNGIKFVYIIKKNKCL
jgi:hypothetical protein